MKINKYKSNFARVDLTRLDNALEEAILPQNDLLTLMYVDKFFSQGHNKVEVKGTIGKTDIDLIYSKDITGTKIKGNIGDTKVSQQLKLYKTVYPSKNTVIYYSGKKVKAKETKMQIIQQGSIASRHFDDGAIYNRMDLKQYVFLMNNQWKSIIRAKVTQDVSLVDYHNQQSLNTTTNYYGAPPFNLAAVVKEDGSAVLVGNYYNMKVDNTGSYAQRTDIDRKYEYIDKNKVLVTGSVSNSPVNIVISPVDE